MERIKAFHPKSAAFLMVSDILLDSGEHRWMYNLLSKERRKRLAWKKTDKKLINLFYVHINFDKGSNEKQKGKKKKNKKRSCKKVCQFCTGVLSGYRFISDSILMFIYSYILSWWVYMKNSGLQASFNELYHPRDVVKYSVIFSQMAMHH